MCWTRWWSRVFDWSCRFRDMRAFVCRCHSMITLRYFRLIQLLTEINQMQFLFSSFVQPLDRSHTTNIHQETDTWTRALDKRFALTISQSQRLRAFWTVWAIISVKKNDIRSAASEHVDGFLRLHSGRYHLTAVPQLLLINHRFTRVQRRQRPPKSSWLRTSITGQQLLQLFNWHTFFRLVTAFYHHDSHTILSDLISFCYLHLFALHNQ